MNGDINPFFSVGCFNGVVRLSCYMLTVAAQFQTNKTCSGWNTKDLWRFSWGAAQSGWKLSVRSKAGLRTWHLHHSAHLHSECVSVLSSLLDRTSKMPTIVERSSWEKGMVCPALERVKQGFPIHFLILSRWRQAFPRRHNRWLHPNNLAERG